LRHGPGSAGAGYGYGGFGQMAGGYTPAGKPAPVTTGDEEEGGAEDGEEEGEKVAPLVTCRLVCCYTLLLLIGYSIGMVANELHWASLKKIHPWLEDLESWLHKPHDDPDHGGMYCSDGLFIPGPARTGANTLIFLTLLCWLFLGVAIAADVFMAGIEKITSEETTRTVVLPSGEVRRYTITVWNATIANLTLMALGSSAPEILLSCIEIGSSGFYAGELGPSTIVGSAAFNMLVISAVCVIAIPDGGSRHIKELPVFYITAAFSLLAYVWLIVILQVVTPNIVDVWEGLVTLIAFPLLVYVAYQADISNDEEVTFDDSPEGQAAAVAVGYGKDGRPINKTDICKALSLKTVERLSEEEQLQAVASLLLPPQSKAYYRQAATRFALGKSDKSDEKTAMRSKLFAGDDTGSKAEIAIVQWATAQRICREAVPTCELAVTRSGNLEKQVTVNYATASGTATEGVDFEAARGIVTFAPGQQTAIVVVNIIDDDEEEDDETFTVKLWGPSSGCQLGDTLVCTVTIQDDDGAGELHFDSRDIEVFESDEQVVVTICRTHGSHGSIGCMWATREGSAKAGPAFEGCKGELHFAEGVVKQTITVPIVDTGAYHRDDDFQIVLMSASGGGRFVTDSATRTRRAQIAAVVRVTANARRQQKVDEMVQLLDFNSVQAEKLDSDDGSWGEQFKEALEPPEDGSSVSMILYGAAMPWKLIGAAVPPPGIANGWACFLVALVFIGVLTALIGDLAGHMGCCMGLKPSVTAITFVALGTSLPDTFASRSAAASEPYADASIVNVTGSNSVNVFLGLGLPWAAAAVYWALHGAEQEGAWRARYKDEPWYNSDVAVGFAVPAGDLAYSVSIYCVASVICLGGLILRRQVLGCELGGPPLSKWATFFFFVGLWLWYIKMSIGHSM